MMIGMIYIKIKCEEDTKSEKGYKVTGKEWNEKAEKSTEKRRENVFYQIKLSLKDLLFEARRKKFYDISKFLIILYII